MGTTVVRSRVGHALKFHATYALTCPAPTLVFPSVRGINNCPDQRSYAMHVLAYRHAMMMLAQFPTALIRTSVTATAAEPTAAAPATPVAKATTPAATAEATAPAAEPATPAAAVASTAATTASTAAAAGVQIDLEPPAGALAAVILSRCGLHRTGCARVSTRSDATD